MKLAIILACLAVAGLYVYYKMGTVDPLDEALRKFYGIKPAPATPSHLVDPDMWEVLDMDWKEEFKDIINHKAAEFDIDPGILRAVIQVESGGNPLATRRESHIPHLEGPDTSFGLMQVLYTTARDMGFEGSETDLCQPLTNIHYGAKYLRRQIDRYEGDILKAIAAYNAGVARYTDNGRKFVNQDYVDKVTELMLEDL